MTKLPIAEYFDLYAQQYEALPKEDSFHISWLNGFLNKRLPNRKGIRVCDLGIGNGRVTVGLKDRGYDLYGVDLSTKQLKMAKKNLKRYGLGANLVVADLSNPLPFEREFFDAVISNAAFHHIEDKEALFGEVHRILKPESSLIFFDFYFDIMDQKYISFVMQLQKKHPRTAQKFLESIKQEGDLMPANLRDTHPREYHIHPRELCKMLARYDFREIRIWPTYYDKYLGISCKK